MARRQTRLGAPLPSLVPAIEGSGPTLRVYSVAGELFPTKQLGIRLGYSRPDGESAEAESYGVGATWFFKPRLAVQLTLSRTTLDDLPILDGACNRAHPDREMVRTGKSTHRRVFPRN